MSLSQPFLLGTSLEPAVIPTAHASKLRMTQNIFSVSLCLSAKAQMVPNIPSCHYRFLM